MATAKGKVAEQTQEKVPPLPKFLCVCEILALVPGLWAVGSPLCGLTVWEIQSGHSRWMK